MELINNILSAAWQLNNDQARKTLEQILNSPEFTHARRLWELRDFFRRLLQRLPDYNLSLDGTGFWLALIVVVAGVLLFIYLLRMVMPFFGFMTTDLQDKGTRKESYVRPTPAALLAEAETKALQGDFRNALRHMYLSLLIEMDNRSVIAYTPAKTNYEYLGEISKNADALKGPFRAMVNLFEYTWYGLQNCAREDFQKGRELYSFMLREASHG